MYQSSMKKTMKCYWVTLKKARKYENPPYSWIWILDFIKMSIFLKLINLMLWQLSLDFKMYRETTKSEHKKFEEEK